MQLKKKKLVGTTLVEMLLVMIISGIVFGVLFDGVELIRRYTTRLNHTFSSSNSVFDSYLYLNDLFRRSDSVKFEEEGWGFYLPGECLVTIVLRDSLLCGYRNDLIDTLFMQVAAVKSVSLEGQESLLDSMKISFLYKGSMKYFLFGWRESDSGSRERKVREFEDYNNNHYYDK